ncbi:serine/threonine-protein kinase [Streptomyces liliifuscus]|uniref:Serine/threonine protein kinase n=1 Tax=Streptomyces liliifuscus TaxID=2797636 RepID=A0A7T7KZI8_9ACTN|nr:serine/threonine-protein kinase [Streptomyces liliifuscus]QQM43689.1 serine/threonine protein kinase [Streptomyces liliifuscus]
MNGAALPLRIGPYLVERQLGAGGMGEVYLAYSVAGEPVAVKVIRPDRTDPHTRARFEREATIARTISGTGRVARFIDADPFAEQPWLAMDYVPGRPLADVVKSQGPLSTPLVASLGALLAEGLAAVHAAGLVHRDLKSQNVVLGDFGPVIIDFGLGAFVGASNASLTQAGVVIGTVRCMPPEQALGEVDVTKAADVYGLGTVLLYAATGHYPYDGARWEAVAAQVVNAEIGPDLSGLPAELTPIVTAMLAHKAEDRPSLEEVTRQCADLMRLLGTSPARARCALIQETTPKDHPTMVLPQPDTPMLDRLDSLERLLREESASPAGGIPVPPPDGESDPNCPAESGIESDVENSPPPVLVPEPLPGTGSPAEPAPQRGRPPASRRVADELRKRYAMGPALTWSKR